jgi:DNA mismatch repair ATPase MutL
MVSAFTEGSVDINLTPDKRQVLIEKESEIWDTLKERLKEIFDKIAPPETGTMNNLEYNKLTNYFEEVKVPGENGDSVENKTRVPQNRDENVEDNFSLSEFKAKLANSKRSQTSCKTGKSTKSR